MYTFKQFMLQAQKQKKCPTGYRFDKKLQVCVPTGVTRYYPYYGGTRGNGDSSNQDNQHLMIMAMVTVMVMVLMALMVMDQMVMEVENNEIF